MGVARGEALERQQHPDIALGRAVTNKSRSWPAQLVAIRLQPGVKVINILRVYRGLLQMTQMCQRAEQRTQKHADIEKEEEDLSNSQQIKCEHELSAEPRR